MLSNNVISPEVKELQKHYELEFDLKGTLESKANNMTTVAGVVATLLLGFGQLFVTSLAGIQYEGIQYITAILLSGCLASLGAVFFSVLGWRIQNYEFVIGSKAIARPNIAASVSSPRFDFTLDDAELIKAYLKAIDTNNKYNISKSRWIVLSQWFFLGSIVVISVLLIWLTILPIRFP
jgi:hypothetical protein